MRHRDSFVSQSLKNIRTVESGHRISVYQCKEINRQWSARESCIIIELGAGDGKLTKQILKKLNPDSRLISIENDPSFNKILKEIKDPRLTVMDMDPRDTKTFLMSLPIGPVDIVLSSIPFMLSTDEHLTNTIQTCHDQLKDGGKFIQMQYSTSAKKLYEKIFGAVQIKFVPFNIPPAFLFIMSKSVNSQDRNKL